MRCCATRSTCVLVKEAVGGDRHRSPADPAARSIDARWRWGKDRDLWDAMSGPLRSPGCRLRVPSGRSHSGTGISAESRAAGWLVAKGFRILARRWKSPVGEIDTTARRRNLLVFVEVKARATLGRSRVVGHRAPARAHRRRRRGVARPQADPRIRDIRFDAVLVAPGRIPRHIPAAFDASG